jgi:hypothetical protein
MFRLVSPKPAAKRAKRARLVASCIFCGESPTTVEHVYSRAWIKGIQPWSGAGFQGILGVKDGVMVHARSFLSSGPGVRAKCVCRKCNNGWMNELDQLVQPVMLPLLSSFETTELSLEDQRMLASWATKIAMVLDYVGPDVPRVLRPPAHRRMYEDRLPPTEAVIFIGGAKETDPFLNDAVRSVSRERALRSAVPRALLVTTRINHLVLHVFAPEYTGWTFDRSAYDEYLTQIWPLTFRPASWPPRKIFDSEGDVMNFGALAWAPRAAR